MVCAQGFEPILVERATESSDRSEFTGTKILYAAFYLAPGAIMSNTEVLAYDFYDLVGNIGGFLGLFLGVSILALFDAGRRMGRIVLGKTKVTPIFANDI